jgi:hypothetical protein
MVFSKRGAVSGVVVLRIISDWTCNKKVDN